MNRYAGKPFLRLLECYVLSMIGQLDEHQQEALRRMEPKLTEIYQTDGNWMQIISAQMDFPTSFPAQIRDVWEKNLALAFEQKLALDPNEFAMAFVDQNFPDIVATAPGSAN